LIQPDEFSSELLKPNIKRKLMRNKNKVMENKTAKALNHLTNILYPVTHCKE